MTGLRARRRVLLVALLVTLVGIGWPAAGQADHSGLRLPAPAGSTWSILGGYNTATHVFDDPHAIDIVREDAPTGGTPVLSPINGTVSWTSHSCLTIADSHGLEILLCHLFPSVELQRGSPVVVGQAIGVVGFAGQVENNGIAHIHLAVHQTLGDGQIQATIPFSGSYALEGVALPDTGAPNAYAGVTFVSSNGLVSPEATPEPTPEPAQESTSEPTPVQAPLPEPEAAPSDTTAIRPVTLSPGWNLVGWTGNTSVAEAVAPIAGSVSAVFGFDAASQGFLRFSPDAPMVLNTLGTLTTGDGVLVHVTNPAGVQWLLPVAGDREAIDLAPGFNLVTWLGEPQSIVDATAGLGDALSAVFGFDGPTQRFESFRPRGLPILNDLTSVETGQALWVRVGQAVRWAMSAGAESTVSVVEPPVVEDDSAIESVVETDETTSGSTGRVLGPGCLNLRTVPTTAGNTPITCLSVGTQLTLTGDSTFDSGGGEWLLAQVNGLTGWVSAEFIVDEQELTASGAVVGSATFYHPSLAGNGMYCGGTYNPLDPTIVATTSWPCGTVLRVSRGALSVDVVVQDTGLLPAYHIDLSEAAFQQLGLLAEGRIAVTIEVLSAP